MIYLGIGFVVTIILLAAMLGLFAKQALATDQQPSEDLSSTLEDGFSTEQATDAVQTNEETGHHPHAM